MIIHVMGASGTGTSTIGELLGKELDFDVIESDFYKWEQTIPEFQIMRPIEESNKLLIDKIKESKNLIITGSLHSNSVTFDYIDLIVYLKCHTFIRMRRIKKRDIQFGRNSLKQEGEIKENFLGFLFLAKNYNKLGLDKRSRASQKWVMSSCENASVIEISTNGRMKKVHDRVLKKVKDFVDNFNKSI